jgi:hypothetical protein
LLQAGARRSGPHVVDHVFDERFVERFRNSVIECWTHTQADEGP